MDGFNCLEVPKNQNVSQSGNGFMNIKKREYSQFMFGLLIILKTGEKK